MLTRPEYAAGAKELYDIGTKYQTLVTDSLAGQTNILDCIKEALKIALGYHNEFEDLLSSTLAEVGIRAVTHYDAALNTQLTADEQLGIVKECILRQEREKYYGNTLSQRLTGSRTMNAQRIRKSAYVGATLDTRKVNIARAFLSTYPYGAQVPLDQRILLSQSLKLEHDVAIAVARKAGVKVVKWTLSDTHPQKDICDDLANRIDKAIVEYLQEHHAHIDPRGLYFIDDVPIPPHPNCQCYLRMLGEDDLTPSIAKRVVETIRRLLGRLRKRRN